MTEIEIYNLWNYYLNLENDLSVTSRYIEPNGQEEVFSLEYSKLLILICTEAETVFKILCKEIDGVERGNIGEYKEAILTRFPKITTAEVIIPRWAETVIPFEGWDSGRLEWWDAYVDVKHSRVKNFQKATYKNSVYSLSALNILIFYLTSLTGHRLSILNSNIDAYIWSPYAYKNVISSPDRFLPDFEPSDQSENKSVDDILHSTTVYTQEAEPKDARNGDIWVRTEG